ncbi:MAG: DNA polymerase II large subunit [Nanoarchaeota archaeon]|nr:DNA polymerase II large subunit [Nanoarchaeota archaeon]
MEASPEMDKYFEGIEKETLRVHEVAEKARKINLDPEDKVDIPLAKNMAERVEGLISSVAPKLRGSGMTQRIRELEEEFGLLDWRVGLKIAEEVAKEKFCQFENKVEAMEVGIRVGFAYLTLGIVSAPLEGFVGLKIKKRQDGGEYFSVSYAGPVRGAGGTAAATSVILSDYVRRVMGYQLYDPSEEEVNRYVTEIRDYHERVTNLQYYPSEEELRFLANHIPVEINGDPTEKFEVSNYKDLPRVETNRIRGGLCLVMAEGVAQKAPKLWKRLGKWGDELGLDWGFLKEFLDLQKSVKARKEKKIEGKGIRPNYTFIADLVAGRPILTHPLRHGGFRLRYGRARVSGFSATCLHPMTLFVLNKYIAIGTQLKVERPGKATVITICDSIEGPIVKLKNGSVLRLAGLVESKDILEQIEEIIYLGDILISYGDFSENGHKLVPAGYCEEWWIQELEKAMVETFGSIDIEKLSEMVGVEKEELEKIWDDSMLRPKWGVALKISKEMKVPLYPGYTYFWQAVNLEEFKEFLNWIINAEVEKGDEGVVKLILPLKDSSSAKRVLELIGVAHVVAGNEYVVVEKGEAQALYSILGLNDVDVIKEKVEGSSDVLEAVNNLSGLVVRDKGGTFIGARMGRPEKSKMRKLVGSPQVLFPVGQEGDRLRSFQSALEAGKIRADFPLFFCEKCQKKTIYPSCEICNGKNKEVYFCRVCGETDKKECKHGEDKEFKKNERFKKDDLDIKYYFDKALAKLEMRTYPDLIKGVRGTSNKDHVIENLVKGILRAKHDIYVNKDGTTRYDMTELPLTHFKPVEIGTSVEKLKELGYEKDIKGRELVDGEQVVEIKPQDIILPGVTSLDESAKKVLFRVSKFIDDLLEGLYGLEPFYNLEREDDLVGHVVVGLAPHISAGLMGRIIGFSSAQGCYAHPLWHAGLRRDCDGDENCVILLLDCFLNFSRQFLPDMRGSRTMDSPLVLTSRLIPSEVDDQAHGLDIVWSYPLELYEGALEFKNPWDISVEQIKNRLGDEKQYEKMGFTHQTTNINSGVVCSAYKTIPTMEDKLKGQMELARRIRAVETNDVARLVIEKHFLKDIKGNLRKFSMQQFRCVKCNEKFRRPPLSGVCRCGGKILFTISEGSIVKYLEPSLSLARQFEVGPYLRQTLDLLKSRIEGLFGKDKERQETMGAWFG